MKMNHRRMKEERESRFDSGNSMNSMRGKRERDRMWKDGRRGWDQ
jgi:hypothetical protein